MQLVVAGDGPDRGRAARIAPPNVRFVGRLSGDEVDRLLTGSRAAVVPSEWAENAPMAVLEPMALGRPVIATRMGGIPEQVRDGEEGILVRAGGRRRASRRRCELLADDAEPADRMGQAARERIATLFSPQRHMTGLLGIYRSSPAAQTAGRRGDD